MTTVKETDRTFVKAYTDEYADSQYIENVDEIMQIIEDNSSL